MCIYYIYSLYMYIHTYIYTHIYKWILPGRSQYVVQVQRAEVTDEVWRQSAGKFPLVWGGQPFVLFRSSTGWMRPTWIIEGNLPFSKPTNLNVNLIQNTFTETSRIGAAKLTHKINDHIWRAGFYRARFRKHRFSWIIGSWNSCLPKYLD